MIDPVNSGMCLLPSALREVKRVYNSDFFQSPRTKQNRSPKSNQILSSKLDPLAKRTELYQLFLFRVHTKPDETKGSPHSIFFSDSEIFFETFSMSPMGPLQFFDILQQNGR